MPTQPRTLFEKIWDRHVVAETGDGNALIYVDRHLVHEVTSAQAFDGLRLSGRKARRPELTFATMDHNVPTEDRMNIKDPVSMAQIEALTKNCREFGVRLYDLESAEQGIVHIIGPELGITLPGLTIVCGDSHTSTHGAFGTFALGIGTSEVEHVLATQTLPQRKPKTFKVEFTGKLRAPLNAKDMILKLIGQIGTAGGTGYVLEYTGDAVRALSMEARMTMCNMSIEGGARAGMIAPDETTFEYISRTKRPFAPQGKAFDDAVAFWKTLPTEIGAKFDRTLTIDASKIALIAAVDFLKTREFALLDCQVWSSHLRTLGATTIPRGEFLERLNEFCHPPGDLGPWAQDFDDFTASLAISG